ncbi:uncharacterized protein B0H18DRAFT_1101325 [Fomitopsis serialis]|uniref:uncharacterized protein n=1 Tax=Fomitopsis serialis TaxID=139415 RepID=UPI002007CC74|nr:uncharacterized protein B0H18DRAFT_1101325 [Neoantrodia serialis]KAH9935628.1 hypothetical protein B0H18DRAFT_1101325 [Neoantrodia serialis]
MPAGSPTPWSYFFIRLLFKFVLKIFYGTIVVENAQVIPPKGKPCIVCANHSNSLTDALLLVTAIPSKSRNLLRLTAKSTQFGKKTFTSWLIESAGTVPIKRRQDHPNGDGDNSAVMQHLIEALECGDAVCLFPEGMSRYHPTIAPLKTGVARLVSDVLSRNRYNPDFEVFVQTCSITYMYVAHLSHPRFCVMTSSRHRQHFRSDVLVTFHEPLRFTPMDNPELLAPIDYEEIRALTAKMHQQISLGTLDAPSWRMTRNAKLAARIYAPLGTTMSLGDYVRVVRTFLEAFKLAERSICENQSGSEGEVVNNENREGAMREDEKIRQLGEDLKAYQDQLARYGIKDDRIRRPLPTHVILYRIVVRLAWSGFLFTISLPGLLLWLPVFLTTFVAVSRFKRTGPIWDTWDEIAQYKLIYGLLSGLCVWGGATLLTLPDAIAAFRAFAMLWTLLRMGQNRIWELHAVREQLHKRVMDMAVNTLGLPPDPETYFARTGGKEKGRVRGRWASKAKYFSVRRRRKRDWNETLRLYDQVDYPEDEY